MILEINVASVISKREITSSVLLLLSPTYLPGTSESRNVGRPPTTIYAATHDDSRHECQCVYMVFKGGLWRRSCPISLVAWSSTVITLEISICTPNTPEKNGIYLKPLTAPLSVSTTLLAHSTTHPSARRRNLLWKYNNTRYYYYPWHPTMCCMGFNVQNSKQP